MKKVVFLDRDGVINREIGDYVYRLEDFVLNDGLATALQAYQAQGFDFVIITNQGGISKKRYSKSDVAHINNFLRSWFSTAGLNLLDIMFCPHHHSVEACICRKPNSLMLEKAIAKHNISVSESFLIGDSPRDIMASEKVGVKGVLIEANSNLNNFHLHDKL